MVKKVWIMIIVSMVVVFGLIFVVSSVTGRASAATQCNDKIDNDGDGRCDWSGQRRCNDGSTPGDSGCSGKTDTTEVSCVANSTTCGVGACQRSSTCINDQVSCTPGSPTSEVCGNSVDEDCDGVMNNGCNPDSCTDSDGGMVYNVQGTVSGYKNNVPYTNTDSCADNLNLIEYYCSGVNKIGTGVNCFSNVTGNGTCVNGACIG